MSCLNLNRSFAQDGGFYPSFSGGRLHPDVVPTVRLRSMLSLLLRPGNFAALGGDAVIHQRAASGVLPDRDVHALVPIKPKGHTFGKGSGPIGPRITATASGIHGTRVTNRPPGILSLLPRKGELSNSKPFGNPTQSELWGEPEAGHSDGHGTQGPASDSRGGGQEKLVHGIPRTVGKTPGLMRGKRSLGLLQLGPKPNEAEGRAHLISMVGLGNGESRDGREAAEAEERIDKRKGGTVSDAVRI